MAYEASTRDKNDHIPNSICTAGIAQLAYHGSNEQRAQLNSKPLATSNKDCIKIAPAAQDVLAIVAKGTST